MVSHHVDNNLTRMVLGFPLIGLIHFKIPHILSGKVQTRADSVGDQRDRNISHAASEKNIFRDELHE